MATKQRITISIDSALLRPMQAIAARRGLSVSALLAERLRAMLADDATYKSAERQAVAYLMDGLRLGTTKITDRQAIHERSG